MSNPVATIGNYIPQPSDPSLSRRSFSKIQYSDWKFYVYGDNEYSGYDPTDKGERFYLFRRLDDVESKPTFVLDSAWRTVGASASGFVTPVNSIMPKIIIPSSILIPNGVRGTNMEAIYKESGTRKYLFNWEISSVNGSAPTEPAGHYMQTSHDEARKYVSVKAKDDSTAENSIVLTLKDQNPQPTNTDWTPASLIVNGAFVLMFNVVPTLTGKISPETVGEQTWNITTEFGEVIMVLDQSGAMKVKVLGGDGDGNEVTVNLAEGRSKEAMPQSQMISDKFPYVILVYPVWNGIVVASGVQDAYATVFSSSYYIPKFKDASIWLPPYSSGFDPTDPDEVQVYLAGSGVDFGSEMTVTARNCRFEIAYVPCFFSRQCRFDEWFVVSQDDPGSVLYDYDVYPIWTKNDTSYDLSPAPVVAETSTPGPIEDTRYARIGWGLSDSNHNRVAGEIFGSILETREKRDFPIKNGNGNFVLTWTGGEGGAGPSSDWRDYIQSISVTVGIDGSSGSITVDKYGCAGQLANAVQSIGAITIDMSGGFGTVPGRIFSGLAFGIEDVRGTDGGTWNINLVGLEKKMDDICLINVPFMDGVKLSYVVDFLCRYAGINYDLSHAKPNVVLKASQDVNAARFDWKSGTSVKSALDDVMGDVAHSYVVRDGTVYVYEIDPVTGFPFDLGPDRSGSYPETKVVTVNSSPDFEDIRNEIVVIGLDAVNQGQGSKITGTPTFPRVAVSTNATTPDIPWARSLVRPIPGFINQNDVEDIAEKLSNTSKVYSVVGRLTIPGNADIKPYDQWDDMVIISVSHNIDFQAKTWTTDLEFERKTTS